MFASIFLSVRRKRKAGTTICSCLSIVASGDYQTLHGLVLTIFCPALQLKALAKSALFCRVPLVRYCPGECGSVLASCRELSGVEFWHHTWAKPRKKRCSGVKPSMVLFRLGSLAMALCSAIMEIYAPPLSAVFSPRVRRPLR